MRIGIIGAGMSGLSLAVHLLQNKNIEKIVLIEQRRQYHRDKTWCYFRLHQHLFEAVVSNRWPSFEIATKTSKKTLSPSFTYEMIQSDHFYQYAVSLLKSDPRAELRLDSSIWNLNQNTHHAEWQYLNTTESFDYIFDSRPTIPLNNGWQQIFSGGVAEMPNSVFDPQCARLMAFTEATDKVKFHYILPLDSNTALIQETWFVPPNSKLEKLSLTDLESYIEQSFGMKPKHWHYQESGIIPMQPWHNDKPVSASRILPIGSAAGWIRGATGYSFLETQRVCARIHSQLANNKVPDISPDRPKLTEALDAIFLRALMSPLQSAPDIFCDLFANANVDSVLRFLGGTGDSADHLKVIMACPKLHFMASAMKHVFFK
jgi:lycopene beta-cyclase